jgi:hypothetical protein
VLMIASISETLGLVGRALISWEINSAAAWDVLLLPSVADRTSVALDMG